MFLDPRVRFQNPGTGTQQRRGRRWPPAAKSSPETGHSRGPRHPVRRNPLPLSLPRTLSKRILCISRRRSRLKGRLGSSSFARLKPVGSLGPRECRPVWLLGLGPRRPRISILLRASPPCLQFVTGKWEGDTLVVETTGFRDGIWLDKQNQRRRKLLIPTPISPGLSTPKETRRTRQTPAWLGRAISSLPKTAT